MWQIYIPGLGYSGPTPTARFDDICQTMDWVADRIIAERCDIIIVAGDMFRKADIALEKVRKFELALPGYGK
jgi:exonuclease SbcD